MSPTFSVDLSNCCHPHFGKGSQLSTKLSVYLLALDKWWARGYQSFLRRSWFQITEEGDWRVKISPPSWKHPQTRRCGTGCKCIFCPPLHPHTWFRRGEWETWDFPPLEKVSFSPPPQDHNYRGGESPPKLKCPKGTAILVRLTHCVIRCDRGKGGTSLEQIFLYETLLYVHAQVYMGPPKILVSVSLQRGYWQMKLPLLSWKWKLAI